jgi:ligand-binding SRPBCC domain-containing protein
MAVHVLEREQWVPTPPEATFELFSDAFALERITPPWLGFRVISSGPIEMCEGVLIRYALKLHGLPVRWLTRIEVWDPPHRFVDRQLQGPYRLWVHSHTFLPREDGTAIVDRVRYELPLGVLGELARIAVVHRDLEQIFDYRQEAVSIALSAGEEGCGNLCNQARGAGRDGNSR